MLCTMHMGKGSQKFKYDIEGVTVTASEEEKDIGVIMHSSAKPARQYVGECNTGNDQEDDS